MHPMRTIRVVDPTDVLWKRVGACLIDAGIWFSTTWVAARILPGWIGAVLTGVFAAVLWLAMYVGLQGVTGGTPGKLLTGLRVVTRDGEICGPSRAAVRSVAWIVDGFPYVFPLTGYAAAFGDQRAQRLGDRWAGTYVVDQAFVGQSPYAVAFPADGREPYLMTTRAAYLPGTAVNPLKGTVPEPAAVAAGASAPAPAALPGSPVQGPVFDPETETYKRWDAVHETWAVFDETERQWVPAPVTARQPA